MQNGKLRIVKLRRSIKTSEVFISEFSILGIVQNGESSVETDLRKYKIPREKHVCPLCFYNNIGNEKHYSFHCTNPKLVEIRKVSK